MIGLAGCAGIRVEGVRYRDFADPFAAPRIETALLHAQHDTFVHDGGRWAGTSFEDDTSLIVGQLPDVGTWFTYISFPLDSLGDHDVNSAILTIPASTAPVLHNEQQQMLVAIHAVEGPWSEEELDWNNQPAVGATPIARVLAPTSGSFSVDLSWWVHDAVQRGETEFDIVLLPAVMSDARIQWAANTEPDGTAGATLSLGLGTPAAPPTQAELDVLRVPPTAVAHGTNAAGAVAPGSNELSTGRR